RLPFAGTAMIIRFIFLTLALIACNKPQTETIPVPDTPEIVGTWKLVSGTLIEDGDSTVTDYTGGESMIKIINPTHFSFLRHDLNKGQDSTAVFVAGGGEYTLEGDQYTEYLEYCSAREWEGNTFHFTVTINADTLTQQGIEKIEDLGIERLNIEKYVRVIK
ncbi:MAG TPA: hypothetical protein VKZ75_04490, partial [Cyclobacteriaceae bacterium]|nr:hypothetical protein [Cyclobacteriaceae bacterium]